MGYITNISSRQNQLIIDVSKLKTKKYRDEKKLFFFEGKKLFFEALNNGGKIVEVFVLEDLVETYKPYSEKYNFKLYGLSNQVYEKITNEKSPEGIFTVCSWLETKEKNDGIILILDSLQDPGNIGTIIRSSDAFNCKQIICSQGCADIYSDRTIRASMGSIFRTYVKTNCDLKIEIDKLKSDGYDVYASVLDDKSIKLGNIKDYTKTAFVIGNEGNGVSKEIIDICTKKVYIPMKKNSCESLNASVAASIILYKASEKKLIED